MIYLDQATIAYSSIFPLSAVDCQWAPWGPWGDCSENCSKGSRNRTRAISVQPSFGGAPCQDNQGVDAENCNLEPCGKSYLTLLVHSIFIATLGCIWVACWRELFKTSQAIFCPQDGSDLKI